MDVVFTFAVGAVAVYAVELGASPVVLGYVGAISAAAYVAACWLAGMLSDRFSRKRMSQLACAAAALSCIALFRATGISQLYLFYGLFYGALGFYWPPVQSLLADSGHRRGLTATLGTFCLSWSFGMALGHAICGRLTEIDSVVPFAWAALICLTILAFTSTLSDKEGEAKMGGVDYVSRSAPTDEGRELWRRFLLCGWLSNFALVFVMGSLKMIFPKLALEHDQLSRTVLGLLLGLIHSGQMFVFWLVKYWHSWQYNRRLYLSIQMIALPGTLLLALTGNVWLYGVAMLMIGVSGGFTYTSSIYYSTSCPPGSSNRTGAHEAMIGLGVLAGPLACGYAADAWGLHAPYHLCTLVVGAALLWQVRILYRPVVKKFPVEHLSGG